MDARVGMGVTNERQQLVTPPEPSVPEHLISPEAAPVRRLPIGAEPQVGRRRPFACLGAPRPRALITKFREEAAGVGFAVVLMTPDDLGKTKEVGDLKPRAR